MAISRTMKAVLLTAALAAGSRAQAQDGVQWGALAGPTFTSVAFSPDSLFDTNIRTVGSGGIFVSRALSETLSLDARLMWVQKSVALSSSTPGAEAGRTSMGYATLPVLLKARVPSSRVRPYALAGPELQIKMGTARLTYTMLGVEEEVGAFDEQFRSWDLALDIGAGVEVPAGRLAVFVEGLYSVGLWNIVRPERSDFDEIKSNNLRVSAGVRF